MVEGILLMADDYSEGQEVFFFNVGSVAVQVRQSTELCGVRRDGLGLRCPWWPSKQVHKA